MPTGRGVPDVDLVGMGVKSADIGDVHPGLQPAGDQEGNGLQLTGEVVVGRILHHIGSLFGGRGDHLRVSIGLSDGRPHKGDLLAVALGRIRCCIVILQQRRQAEWIGEGQGVIGQVALAGLIDRRADGDRKGIRILGIGITVRITDSIIIEMAAEPACVDHFGGTGGALPDVR